MCGIALILGPDVNGGNTEFLERELEFMLARQAHRGEITGIHRAPGILAGVRRLPIVARESAAAAQPLVDQAGNILLFNGEIYNYRELARDLKRENPTDGFDPDSDTSVLLASLRAHGALAASRLRGQFAFVFIQSSSGRVLLGRDTAGIKPLYRVRKDGRTYFASEIKALCFLGSPTTIEGIPPGHIGDETGNLFPFTPPAALAAKPARSEQEWLAELRTALSEATRDRVQTDLPLAVILSGGLDSSLILRLALGFNTNVTAFTVGAGASDDVRFARRLCEEYAVRHVVVPIEARDIHKADIKEAVRISELSEYGDIINAVVTIKLTRAIADHGFKILLSGDGSDELFGGYDMHARGMRVDMNEDADSEKSDPLDNARRLTRLVIGNLHRTELQRLERAAMAYTVEARVPFLDERVRALALEMPPDLKRRAGVEKYCLRAAFRDMLPDYILNRPKNPMSHSSGLHEKIRLFKPLFARYYHKAEYSRLTPLRRDFSRVLRENDYDAGRAERAAALAGDYPRLELYLESLKALRRLWFTRR